MAGGPRQQGKATFTMTINGREAAEGQVTEDSADVLQQFDPKYHVRAGPNEVAVEVKGESGLLYQGVGRHSEPFKAGPPTSPVLDVVMDYDRTSLSTRDVLRAKATVKCNGRGPTQKVIVGLWSSSSAPTPPPATRP